MFEIVRDESVKVCTTGMSSRTLYAQHPVTKDIPIFSAAIRFAMKCSAPCSAVLRHSPSSWAAVVHWSALMPKALRSSRKHPIYSFFWPPTQPAPPTNFPNTTQFGSLVSSMRTTNPANKIRLLRKIASMLSLPVLISVSR